MIHDDINVGDVVVVSRPELQCKDIYVIIPIQDFDGINEKMRFYRTAQISNRDYELGNWTGKPVKFNVDGTETF